jgi:four helix bundle protein
MTNDKIQISNESSMTNKKFDISDRALEFAARVAKFVNMLPKNQASIEYSRQLIRSSASIGANIEEADGTLSKRDFVNKIAIGRREARESRYWLRLLKKAELLPNDDLNKEAEWLIGEAREIMLILSSIVNKVQLKNKI